MELSLAVERTAGAKTLPVQLADQIRDRITGGTLAKGDRVPSTRSVAADLDISRAVVEQAYDQLLAEGWLVSRRGAGTFVAAVPGRRTRTSQDRAAATRPALVRLGTGTPWVDPRHSAGWRRAWREVSATTPPPDYPDACGLPELREAIATQVARARGIDCTAGEVVVTLGTTDGLRHLLGVLPGDHPVAIEDPGYRAAVTVTRAAGRDVVDVPVDEEGLSVGALAAHRGPVAAVFVTPAHQHPTGVTMSAGRRVALLAEARRRDALVVEDDYDSQFRYDVAPLPALAALDRERVVHLGTASKSVSPGLRLGWLVAPAGLVQRIGQQREETHDLPSWPVQRAWLAMLRDGHVDRLVRSARRVYAERGRRVAAALSPYGELGLPVAGMYVTLRLPQPAVERARRACRRAGFDLPSLEETARSSGVTGLVLGYGGITDAQLEKVLEVLVDALGSESAQPRS